MVTHEVVKYVALRFDKNWKCTLVPTSVMQYTPSEKEAELTVLAEGDAGLWSYVYRGIRGDVYVIGDLVHIPAKFVKKFNANTLDP